MCVYARDLKGYVTLVCEVGGEEETRISRFLSHICDERLALAAAAPRTYAT